MRGAKRQRGRLLTQRTGLPHSFREHATDKIVSLIETWKPELHGLCIGLYWPFRAEIDLRAIAEHHEQTGINFALPVVVKKGAPLEFRQWQPGARLTRGV